MMSPDPVKTLNDAHVVAVIGASSRIHRPSHHAVDMLKNDGYAVIPINPRYDRVLDLRCYPSLDILPDTEKIDIVNVFRRPEAVPELLTQVAKLIERTGHTSVVWTQLGVSSREAAGKSAQLGIPYIEERCIMVELERIASRRR